jgi:O-antigen/teichoic acid export membrane protein
VSLLRNSAANFLGAAMPALVVIVTTPLIVHLLGVADYGLLTIIASIVGYFAIIDLNTSSGIIKFVAEFRARGDARSESGVIVLGFMVACLVGVVGALGLMAFAEPLARRVFEIPPDRIASAVSALEIAATGFLVGQLQQYALGLPQALQRYDISATIETVFGIAVPTLTVAVLLAGYGLEEVVLLRVCCAAINFAVLLWVCRSLFPEFSARLPNAALTRRVLSFGGFAYLSRLASLTYLHADKLIIGGMLGLEAVAYYAVAATIANRILGITFRLSAVMYPAASAFAAAGLWGRLRESYFSAARYVFYLNASLVLALCLFSSEILHFWMGPEFATRGAPVMILVSLAMLVDSLSNLPSMVNDGLGHSRVTGLFAITRAAFGLAAVYLMAGPFGVEGVAAAHLLASVVMVAAFLLYVHGRSVPISLLDLLRHGYLKAGAVAGALALAGFAARPPRALTLPETIVGGTLLALSGAVLGLALVLKREDRRRVIGGIRARWL